MVFIDKKIGYKTNNVTGPHRKISTQSVRKLMILATAFFICTNSFSQQISNNLINRYDPARLVADGRLCAQWYSQFLDSEGDTYEVVEVDGSVFTIEIYTSNRRPGYGGHIATRASCEIKNGRLDHGWTKIHAQRGGWIAN